MSLKLVQGLDSPRLRLFPYSGCGFPYERFPYSTSALAFQPSKSGRRMDVIGLPDLEVQFPTVDSRGKTTGDTGVRPRKGRPATRAMPGADSATAPSRQFPIQGPLPLQRVGTQFSAPDVLGAFGRFDEKTAIDPRGKSIVFRVLLTLVITAAAIGLRAALTALAAPAKSPVLSFSSTSRLTLSCSMAIGSGGEAR